jgi:AcrR family transcriptional regulator
MTEQPPPSARKTELLELAYQYAIQHGRTELSLRPMALAIGSSPRVLLYLFGSKDGLIRALLARSRADELALLAELRGGRGGGPSLREAGERIWSWLADEARRPLLRLTEPTGPWAGFARATVSDWLGVLAELQPPAQRHSAASLTERTLLLTVLRGSLIDLLATDDAARTTAAVRRHLATLTAG